MQEIKIGYPPTADHKRDAVHIAVIPVIAAHKLTPGWSVSVVDNLASVDFGKDAVGLVDPFLREDVLPGHLFWLFLYPGTTQQLRHDWSHPAFPEPEPEVIYAEDVNVRGSGPCAC